MVKKEVKKAKKKQLDEKIKKLEDDFKKTDSHNFFKTVREVEGKPKKNLMITKNQKKDKTIKTEEVLKIWKDHFRQHLNIEFPHDENILQSIPSTTRGIESSLEELTITKEEVRKVISSLKNNKAPGSDLTTAEVLKATGEPMVNTLRLIFSKVLNEETTPTHFSKMLVTPIYKKGDKSLPENYGTTALLSIPGKVLNKILLSRIREKTKVFTSDRQHGFRPNRGTIDAIFIVRQLMQKSKQRGINCHFHFADFKSAFDTIWRKALWRMMRSIGFCNKIVSIIEKMYEKTTCTVAVDGLLTEWFSLGVGVRQGCLLSPTLFNLFLDFVMDELKCLQEHVTLDNDLNFDARYADDITLIAAVFEKLQLATNQLQEACKKYGMKIDTDKCKVVSNSHTNITIENENVENVEEFKFLGSVIPNSSLDVKRRIAAANSAFGRLKKSV